MQDTGPKLGDILLRAGWVTQEQLQTALTVQAQSNRLLGAVMIEMDLVTSDQVREALASQAHIPSVDLSRTQLLPEITGLLPGEFCRRHSVVPIALDDDLVTVAAADPANVIAMDMVRAALPGRRLKIVAAHEPEIVSAIEGHQVSGSAQAHAFSLDLSELLSAVESGTDSRTDLSSIPKLMHLPGVIMAAERLFRDAAASRATRIIIEPTVDGARVRVYQNDEPVASSDVDGLAPFVLIARLKSMAQLDASNRGIPQQGVIAPSDDTGNLQVTVACLPTVTGERVSMRLLHSGGETTKPDSLGMARDVLAQFESMLATRSGLVLVAGHRSGLGRTLRGAAAVVAVADRTVISLERPVEQHVPGITQVPLPVSDPAQVATALLQAQDQEPDALIVSGTPDRRTAEAACEAAAERLVVLGVGADNIALAARRLLDLGLDPYALSATLVGAVAQRTARLVCAMCIRDLGEQPDLQNALLALGDAPQGVPAFRSGAGCQSCGDTGFSYVATIYEIAASTPGLRAALQRGASAGDLQALVSVEGSATIGAQVLALAWRGATPPDEALRVSLAERAINAGA
ncbi:MAG TPA: ATPase, T2SS/T4P/T4SS family [Armatimonadota bacterium]|nr:ATPase, T2SS/T4P/T4SS family [Armatimonadota bacterium]